jgi:hypothetical protein
VVFEGSIEKVESPLVATLPAPFHVLLSEDVVAVLTFMPINRSRVRSDESIEQLRTGRVVTVSQLGDHSPRNDNSHYLRLALRNVM